jgi:hypothetical protein
MSSPSPKRVRLMGNEFEPKAGPPGLAPKAAPNANAALPPKSNGPLGNQFEPKAGAPGNLFQLGNQFEPKAGAPGGAPKAAPQANAALPPNTNSARQRTRQLVAEQRIKKAREDATTFSMQCIKAGVTGSLHDHLYRAPLVGEEHRACFVTYSNSGAMARQDLAMLIQRALQGLVAKLAHNATADATAFQYLGIRNASMPGQKDIFFM